MIRKLEVEGWSKPIKTPLNFNEDLNIITVGEWFGVKQLC